MKLPGDACSLGEPLLELHVQPGHHLPDTTLVTRPGDTSGSHDAEREEPCGLVEGRRNGEFEGCPGLVPDAVVVRGHDSEAIGARTGIRVEDNAASAGVAPLVVQP